MQRVEGRIIYSPSDLVRFVRSPWVAWMERAYLDRPPGLEPDPEDPQLAMLAKKGDTHEQRMLDLMAASGHEIRSIPKDNAEEATLKAISDRAPVIFQPKLSDGVFAGYADFLALRSKRRGSESNGYVVLDAKLARHVRPYFLVQLCCYADMLQHMTGERSEHIGVILGDGREELFRLSDFVYYYRHVRHQFLELMDRFPHGEPPEPDPMGELGRWGSHAERWALERDHLSRVANITRGQIKKLEAAGIPTLAQLAAFQGDRPPGIEPPTFERLQRQASLQLESAGQPEPQWAFIAPEPGALPAVASLPPPNQGDVCFDIEGYPLAEGGLEYLLGVALNEGEKPEFLDWWAHDQAEEKRAFEQFMDWVTARKRAFPGMHIYHYGHYEPTALKRLMGKYGTREDEVDNLLRDGTLVDLHRVVVNSIQIGEPRYSLKNLEHLWAETRAGEVATAGDSVVYYDAWTESDEPPDWRSSPLLKSIRDYNEEDCISTRKLVDWLRDIQPRALQLPGSPWVRLTKDDEAPREPSEAVQRRLGLAGRLLRQAEALEPGSDERTISQMLGWLVEFHRRANKPLWWTYFDRLERTEEELAEDLDCLAGVIPDSARPEKRSHVLSCRFPVDQDTKLTAGDPVVIVMRPPIKATLTAMDRDGTLELKVSQSALTRAELAGPADLPSRFCLIPDPYVNPSPIDVSIEEAATAWAEKRELQPALRDFLLKQPPQTTGQQTGPLAEHAEDNISAGTRICRDLADSVLCIQGPPGTGKTYTAARIIQALLADGKKVGISSNSHKAILNLMKAVYGINPNVAPMLKVGGKDDDPLLLDCPGIDWKKASQAGADSYRGGLVGGTAWLFAHEDMARSLDYLFVDEAGQVSVGNLVGMARSARNLVLMGDQMQLGQPIQGEHPGESGSSVLEYYLAGHQTIPADRGLFLGTTWRLHPRICSFISEAMYEDRLFPEAKTRNREIVVPEGARLIDQSAGIAFVEVPHVGNRQSSDEEVDAIQAIVKELLGRTLLDSDGNPVGNGLELDKHLLFVAPFNMQVRKLQKALGPEARVGSVDKFQGQEAPVVIISLCSSEGEGSRGIDFVLDRNRLNVAVSRAQSLAIIVGSPGLGLAHASSVESMRRLNLFHQLSQHATSVRIGSAGTESPTVDIA